MDGVAISVRFEKGYFVRAVTRGNGKAGDDVTANIKTIASLPLKLCGENIPDVLEIRGEVFLPHDIFSRLNEQRIIEGEEEWANPRNAAAGSLKLLDPKEVARRQLSLAFYGIAEDSSDHITKQSQVIPFLKSLGLPVVERSAICHDIDEIWKFAEEVRHIRFKLSYDIDGIVIKLDNIKEQKRLGKTGKNPRWAIAYKFAAEQGITRIKDITVQIGRTGVLTPVAELEPIFVAGSTIARATLHNEEEVERKGIRVGDVVAIEKGGDVIPKIVSVDISKRPLHSEPWKMPNTCPCCGTPVVRVEGEVAVRCPNEKGCFEQHIRQMIYFAGKEAMDINNLGEKVMTQLVQKKIVKNPSDIYALTESELIQLEGFKEKSVSNLLEGIDASKQVSFSRFIMALGIKHIGSGTAELLAARAGDIWTLMSMDKAELISIEGVGEKVAQSVIDYFAEFSHREEVERLLALGVKPKSIQVLKFTDHLFADKLFVLTGGLEHYTRTSAASLIKERGGKVVDSVSKKTDYILAGSDPGSKLEKGKALGITVLTESEFISML